MAPDEKVDLPAGSTELEIYCAALSYAAPKKYPTRFS
jgi:hypothetical protein